MDERSYTVAEIAGILGVSKRAVQKRAKKESWPAFAARGKGGVHACYPLPGLPHDVRLAVCFNGAAAGRDPADQRGERGQTCRAGQDGATRMARLFAAIFLVAGHASLAVRNGWAVWDLVLLDLWLLPLLLAPENRKAPPGIPEGDGEKMDPDRPRCGLLILMAWLFIGLFGWR